MVGLQILQQPRPCCLAEGDPLVLECRAQGNPPPQYQWFRNRRPVEGARDPRLQVLQTPHVALCGMAQLGVGQWSAVWGSSVAPALHPLQVQLVTTAERGTYSCRVFNLFHELWSQEVDVEIGEGTLCIPCSLPYSTLCAVQPHSPITPLS